MGKIIFLKYLTHHSSFKLDLKIDDNGANPSPSPKLPRNCDTERFKTIKSKDIKTIKCGGQRIFILRPQKLPDGLVQSSLQLSLAQS